MQARLFLFPVFYVCLLVSAGGAGADEAAKRQCNDLLGAATSALGSAEAYCSGVEKCRWVVSYLKQEQCFDARKSESGCTTTLNACLERGAEGRRQLARQGDARARLEQIMLERCAKYEWNSSYCENPDFDRTAGHCPGTVIFLSFKQVYEDPDFSCENNIRAETDATKLYDERRRDFFAANCDKVAGFEGWTLEPFVCEHTKGN